MNLYTRTEKTDPCHPGDEWWCAAQDCGRLQCRRCDGIPNDSGTCWECFQTEPDHESGDAA